MNAMDLYGRHVTRKARLLRIRKKIAAGEAAVYI
jgi:hypothetical protein